MLRAKALRPRSQSTSAPAYATAPEKGIDLEAMRHLANLSAKSAIHTHDSKRLGGTSRIKLAVSLLAGVAGVALLVLSFAGGMHLMTMISAFAAFAVAALWGGNYIWLTKQMIGKRMSHLERHHKADDESPNSAAADAPQQQQEAVAAEQDANRMESETSP